MQDNRNVTPVTVFSGSQWEAGMVKSMLEDVGIKVYMNDENRAANIPVVVDAGGLGVVRVVVSSSEFTNAMKVVSGYKENLKKA